MKPKLWTRWKLANINEYMTEQARNLAKNVLGGTGER